MTHDTHSTLYHRYRERMENIRAILAHLKIETEQAESYRGCNGIEIEDLADLDCILVSLTSAYRILAADAVVSTEDILHRVENPADVLVRLDNGHALAQEPQ